MTINNGMIKKGEVRNPKGRPKGSVSVVRRIKEKLQEYDGDKALYLDRLVDILFDKAISEKDIQSIKEIIDRADGKAKQEIEGEMNVNINIIKYDGN